MGVSVDMRVIKVWCEICQSVHDRWTRACPSYVPTIDWASMSPRAVWEGLKDAPLVAGPWEVFKDGSGAMRPDHCGNAATLLSAENDTLEGRKADDAEMIKNGWILVDLLP